VSTLSHRVQLSRFGGRLGRYSVLNAVLAAAVAGLGVVAYLETGTSSTSTGAGTRTSTVARGVVLSTVSASGNVQAAKSLTVDFQTSGILRRVRVEPGEKVSAGQVLGVLDDRAARVQVKQAEASLASARAQLQQTLRGETAAERRQDRLTVAQSKSQLAGAKAALAAQKRTNALDARSFDTAVKQAQTQLRTDQGNLRGTVAKLHADQAQLGLDEAAADQADALVSADQAQVAADQADQQRISLGLLDAQQAQTAHKASSSTAQSVLDADAASIASWQREQQQLSFRLGQDQAKLSTDQQTLSAAGSAVGADEANVESSQSTIVALEKAIVQDRNAIRSAQQSRTSGLERNRQALDSAQRQVASAQQSLASAQAGNAIKQAPPEPATVAQQRAAIVQAEADLETAQQALAQTVLRSPSAGVVSAVDGIAGQSVSGGGSSAAAASASTSGTGTGSAAFVSLTDLRTMQVIAPFSETDAASLRLGQAATVTVAALSGAKLPAHIAAIDVASTVNSGVVTYDVTFQLDRRNAKAKPGMTADVEVVVGERDNVLHVPAAAITGSGANAAVTVLRSGVETRVPVVVGLRGDSATEIVSGLRQGDAVVLPSATLTSLGATAGTTGRGGLTGGGLGRAGFAGGGFAGGRG
jgi:multidrug efflux pump subunit AcrA (membrane-fusion protein)